MDNIQRRDNEMLYRTDEQLMSQQARARRLTQQLNTMDRSDFEGIAALVKQLISCGKNAFINPPFYCDYGFNIQVGDNFFCNYNCTILDVGRLRIGNNCLFAPNVSIYTAGHPVHPAMRNTLYEYGIDVNIGSNVWLGGNVIVCPGVTIGDNTVIGAGSVVTKDVPSWCVAVGNPCRVIREITDEDMEYYFQRRKPDSEAAGIIREMIKTDNEPEKYPFRGK